MLINFPVGRSVGNVIGEADPEDQEVRVEILLARIAWLEEVIENQWKQIETLREINADKYRSKHK